MRETETIQDADDLALALHALVWTLSEDSRAQRLLALTGLDPADLRARADDPVVLAAVLNFLQAHQSDLIGCAQAIGAAPERLVLAAERLGQ